MWRDDRRSSRPWSLHPDVVGALVQPVRARPVEQIDAGDIARALANVCRFGGHTRAFYSVAQHSVIVSELVEARGGDVEDVFAALMHDATEAYLGDMPHPIKHRSPLGAAFKEAENRLEAVLRARFAIKADVPEIKRVDRALLATERGGVQLDLLGLAGARGRRAARPRVGAWSPDEAARRFTERYAELDAVRVRPGPRAGFVLMRRGVSSRGQARTLAKSRVSFR